MGVSKILVLYNNLSLTRAMHGKATENEINSKIRIILQVRLQN